MQEPLIPPDEAERLADLQALQLLDTQPEERFDRITRVLKQTFDVEAAQISLIDTDRQWFKSRQGHDMIGGPRSTSFCGHAILANDPFVIPDAHADVRFADNPLVTSSPFIRFYAGMPLRGPRGYRVGTLCMFDSRPRRLSASEIQALRDLAAWAESELSNVRLAEATRMARESAANARRQVALLEAVMESTDAIVFVRDLEGRFLFANKPYAKLFEREGVELVGRHMSEIFPADQVEEFRRRDLEVLRDGVARREENLLDPTTGIHPHLVVRSPLRDENGEIYGICGVGTDLTQTRLVEKAMRGLNRQLRATTVFQQAILNSANFSIISTDVDGVIRLFNVGAQRMLGYTPAEVVERKTLAILHDLNEVIARAQALTVELGVPVTADFEALVAKARRGVADEHEWTYTRKDGGRFTVQLSMTALRDEHDELTGFLAIAYDITERKQVESMKTEFISTVSHELRTPLTSIRGSLGLLVGGAVGEMPPRASGLLEIAKNNCERLVRLINDILDIEKIESGNMRFDFRAQPLRAIAEQALAATREYAAQLQVGLRFEPGGVDAWVIADTDRIIQVIVNLVSNAAKFSPTGADVLVALQSVPGAVRLSVTDRGPGIPPEFRSRIFQKFAQADSSDTRKKGGTGLGLSICKAIVEKHNGRIDFVSAPGRGSEFFFDLPFSALPERQAAAPGAQILVCEDDDFVAHSLAALLRNAGMTADIAATAADARRMLEAGDYAAMTLDLVLPDEDGASLLGWIRAQDKLLRLPVVIVSASADQARTELGGAFGVADWLSKPVDRERLTQSLRALLNGGSAPAVLYVEDDSDLARVIGAALEPAIRLTLAASLAEARALLAGERYDAVLLDLALSDGDGAELLGALPAPNADTPVVVFSARESAGADLKHVQAQLVKSRTSHEELLATLQGLIARTRQRQHTQETQ